VWRIQEDKKNLAVLSFTLQKCYSYNSCETPTASRGWMVTAW